MTLSNEMVLLIIDPYKSKYMLGSGMWGEGVPFQEACLAGDDIIL